jgi:hypothetical protein
MGFLDIPLRANGQKFYHDWFNSLRSAGVAIEAFFGTNFINETSFTLANNQGAPANVTGLSFDQTSVRSALIYCEVRRKTDSNEVITNGTLRAYYRVNTTTWEILDELGGDDDGVTFSITSAGQIQYISTDLTGTNYSGRLLFKAITFAA